MSLIAVLIAAQALTVADIRPNGFYLSGVRQGMTSADYNAVISNGGYQSKPVDRDRFIATIEGQDVIVTFCNDKVVMVVGNYTSFDWAQSIQALQQVGFAYEKVFPYANPDTSSSKSGGLAIGGKTPVGFTYSVTPVIKAFEVNRRDFPTFQLQFEATNNACQLR